MLFQLWYNARNTLTYAFLLLFKIKFDDIIIFFLQTNSLFIIKEKILAYRQHVKKSAGNY